MLSAAAPEATVIDLKGRRVIPGLIDSHMHIIRGGLNYNMELRWDGVPSLADAMAMLKAQVARTPAPQWVRVVGGFTEHQFAEKRLPTIEELNAAALRVVGYTKDTPNPPGGEIVRTQPATPPACCWPSPTPPSSTRPSPRGRSCRPNTRSTPPGTSCAR